MSNSQTQNKRQIGQLNHKKRLVPIYEDYDKNDVKVGLGTYRKPNGETYIKLDEIPTATAYTAKTINGNDVVTDNGKIYGNSQEEANTKYGRYRLTHPNETARRTDQYMAQKYGSEWRDDSKYGMKPTMEAFNAITAGMLNRLSPTQNARLIYDLVTNPSKGASGMFNGNMGIVTDKFAQEHPWLSLTANIGGDMIALGGPSLYNAGKNVITSSKPYRARQIAKEMNKTFNENIVYEDSPLIGKQIYTEYPKNPTKIYTTNKPQIQPDSPLLTRNKNNQILSLPYYKDNSKEIARAITRDEAKRINAWSKLYGYPPLQEYGGKRTLDELIDDPIMYNAAVMERAKEHNTFLRGVHKLLPKQKSKLSESLGRQLSDIEAMKESAVRYAPYTGAGRSNLGHTPKGIGANYSSNMFNQALGYAIDDMQPSANGIIATIRRPIDYTNFRANKAQFILDNDFTLNNPKSIIRDEYIAHPILMRGKSNPKFKDLQYEYIKNKNLFEIDKPELNNGISYRNIGRPYYKNKFGDTGVYEDVVPKEIQSPEDFIQNSHEYYGIKEVPNPLSVKIIEAAKTKFNTDNLNNNLTPFLNDLYKYSEKVIKQRGEKYLDDEINRALSQIKDEYIKKHYKKYLIEGKNYAIEQLGLKSGILKPKPKDRIILHKGFKTDNALFDNKYRGTNYPFSERVLTSTRNTGDPRQHFIFTGPVNEKGFDLIDFTKITPELLEMPYSRAHFLKYMRHTPGTSRKSYKYGGTNK